MKYHKECTSDLKLFSLFTRQRCTLFFVVFKLPPCGLLTHPNYKTDRPPRAVWHDLCLCALAYSWQFNSALIATASTAEPNGVLDQEIRAQAFHIHLPTASQILCSITMRLGETRELRSARDVQSRNIKVNGILRICVYVSTFERMLLLVVL